MTMSLTAHASQATQIEQARAVAEVAAAIRYAQDNPRDEDKALAMFKRSCQRVEFAQRAFFRYRRGTAQVTGPTITFAQEAARCWQNMTSGTSELARRAQESEMVAFAWDLEMNTQRRTTFVNPHTGYTDTPKDDKPARQLVAVRDVRENNQSAGSRVEREMILAILPTWYIEKGKAWATEALAKQGGDEPIEDRRRGIVEKFEALGVRREQLIRKLGVPVDQWIEADLATLLVIGRSIHQGETTVDAEFHSDVPDQPKASVTAAAITTPPAPSVTDPSPAPATNTDAPSAAPPAEPAAAPAAAEEPAPDPAQSGPAPAGGHRPRPALAVQKKRIGILASDAGLNDDDRLAFAGAVIGRTVASTNDLTSREASQVVDRFEELQRGADFAAAVEDVIRADDQRRMEAELAAERSES